MSFAGSNNSQVLCSSVLIGSYSIADGWFLKPCFCYFLLVSGKLSKIHAERTLKNHGPNEVFVNPAKISKEFQTRGTFWSRATNSWEFDPLKKVDPPSAPS